MKVFSGSSNKPLAEKIAKQLGVSLSPCEIFIFPDGERRVRLEENVVDEDVIIVQTFSPHPDTHIMELFFLVDAAKRSGAKSITAVVPYLGYQRQDHVFRDGEAVSLNVVIKTLEASGVDKIITFDLHSIKIPELFKIPIIHLSALSIFAEKIKQIINGAEVASENFRLHNTGKFGLRNLKTEGVNAQSENSESFPRQNDTILVSPDMGGIRRIKIISELLDGAQFAAIEKNRDLATGDIASNKFGEGFEKGAKRAIIVDDMISTGRTIVAACDLLLQNGVEEVFVFATHPVFSNNASKVLQESKVAKVFVTDTIEVQQDKVFEKLEVLSVAQVIAGKLKN
ncbi:MAG: ribose-phosphate pyrophosphokinase [Patescibacteria group bacterium]